MFGYPETSIDLVFNKRLSLLYKKKMYVRNGSAYYRPNFPPINIGHKACIQQTADMRHTGSRQQKTDKDSRQQAKGIRKQTSGIR